MMGLFFFLLRSLAWSSGPEDENFVETMHT